MKNLTKKVVILENLASPYVHQAIIIMRDYNPKLDNKAITEAERIVSAYLDNMKLKNGQSVIRSAHKKRHFLIYLAISAISVIATLAFTRL